jgi:hypothetical protein
MRRPQSRSRSGELVGLRHDPPRYLALRAGLAPVDPTRTSSGRLSTNSAGGLGGRVSTGSRLEVGGDARGDKPAKPMTASASLYLRWESKSKGRAPCGSCTWNSTCRFRGADPRSSLRMTMTRRWRCSSWLGFIGLPLAQKWTDRRLTSKSRASCSQERPLSRRNSAIEAAVPTEKSGATRVGGALERDEVRCQGASPPTLEVVEAPDG